MPQFEYKPTYHFGTIAEALSWACQQIEAVDARMLLQYILQVNHAYLLTHAECLLPVKHAQQYAGLVMQREKGIPVAYLTCESEFYDLVFKVSPAVLIPRPETELLVELALENILQSRSYRILDLGTGSGVIGITLAKHRPRVQVTAVDVSAAALEVAKWNAQNLTVSNICFIQGSWFEELVGEKFDLIVANPPYVAEHDPHLQQGDLRFEPPIALSASDNGSACIRHIITVASAYLVDDGHLLLEHGYDQSLLCRKLLAENGYKNVDSYVDLAGIKRVSGGRYCSV